MCESADSQIAVLERWELHGGGWRTLSLSASEATVELRTCLGEPAERIRSSDPKLLAYLAKRPRSDVAQLADPESDQRASAARTEAEETGMASFPASDPPACWTWDPAGADRSSRD